MSVCGLPDEENLSEEGGPPPPPLREDYQQKSVSTVVRVLTVLAYLLSVSLAAILLSFYYICVWKSPELPPMNETELGEMSAQRADEMHGTYTRPFLSISGSGSGGSNITMKESNQEPAGNSSTPFTRSTAPIDLELAEADSNFTDTADVNYEDHNNNTDNDPTLNITNSIT